MLKRVPVLALCIALVVPSLTVPAGADDGFSDVPSDHPFVTEIGWLVDEGITTGFSDGEAESS